MTPISEIKLIRTDTTLDLSQKAEKVWKLQLCSVNFVESSNVPSRMGFFFCFTLFYSAKKQTLCYTCVIRTLMLLTRVSHKYWQSNHVSTKGILSRRFLSGVSRTPVTQAGTKVDWTCWEFMIDHLFLVDGPPTLNSWSTSTAQRKLRCRGCWRARDRTRQATEQWKLAAKSSRGTRVLKGRLDTRWLRGRNVNIFWLLDRPTYSDDWTKKKKKKKFKVVVTGIEPMTFGLLDQRSTNWAKRPRLNL